MFNAFYLSKRLGDEYKESTLVARRPMMVSSEGGGEQIEVPFATIVELVNENVPAFKSAPTFEVKDGEVHLTKLAVDALFGKAWEGHDTKLLSTETVAERRSFYVLAEGYSGADFKVGREMHSLLRSAFGGIDGVGFLATGAGESDTGAARVRDVADGYTFQRGVVGTRGDHIVLLTALEPVDCADFNKRGKRRARKRWW